MVTLEQAFQVALQHHQAGRLGQAEQLYRGILARQPSHPEALRYLGVLAAQTGRNDIAADLIRHALILNPNWPDAFNDLGVALYDGGRLDEAIAAFRQAIALKPLPEAYSNLGNALKENGQPHEAIAACRQAIALKSNYTEAHNNLGNALKDSGRLDEAIASYRQAIALKPNYAQALSNLGNALIDKGQPDDAIAACHRAIALEPNYPDAHNNLGNALQSKGRLDEAIASYRQAITLDPSFARPHNNLGNALKDNGQVDEPVACYRKAIALRPSYPEAYNNLGVALNDKGQIDEALAAFRQAMVLKPDSPEVHDSLVLALHYHPGYDVRAIAEEHRRWNRLHAEPHRAEHRPHANNRDPDRRLRIGYVSPDFRGHVVGRFLLPLLAHHDKSAVEVFAYAQVPVADAMTSRLRSHTDGWRSTVGLTGAQAADLIRQDRIDVLVDLAGHTAGNRLLVFARKPAPVQVSWLGYPGTTGLTTIDYRLTDAYTDPFDSAQGRSPPGRTEEYQSEQLLRLAPSAWCYQPGESPPVSPRPDGPITFGCFNNFAKVTEPMLRAWGRILQAVPGSRLLLKAQGLGSESVRRRVQGLLSEIAPDRLELRGHEPSHGAHLALYGRMDIALDTFPYHGTTTTCEALWMGVPVVSLAGESHVSRVGVSLLNNVGLPELVADSPDDYVRIAVGLANDPARLGQLRSTLRRQMEQSPLMDAPCFARDIEAAFRQMWREWCEAKE